MGFDKLLGNDALKASLTSAQRQGKLSHFYLITGPKGSGKHTLSDLIAAAMLCQEPGGPCGVCRSCRKLLSGNHPDYRTIDDPQKKTVPVDLIREARADLYIRPNEGSRKIYRFPRAQDMGIPGQNALLKVLEEPPSYGVFLLLADNAEALLPTVRSRCVELKLQALPSPLLRQTLRREFPQASEAAVEAALGRSGGYLGQARALMEDSALSETAQAFALAYAAGDPLALLAVLTPMEKWKRDALLQELAQWVELLEQALLVGAGLPGMLPQGESIAATRNARSLMTAVDAIKQAMEYAQGNVSPGAICGWLSWALR